MGRRACVLMCVLLAATVAGTTGCRALSEAAYTTARLLDPDCHPPSYESCESLAATRTPPTSCPLPHAHSACPSCLAGDTPDATFNIQAEVEGLQTRTTALQQSIATVENELAQRSDALVETRAELARVRRDMGELGKHVSDWQYQLAELRGRLQARDQQRLAQLQQITSMIEHATAVEVIQDTPAAAADRSGSLALPR
jgi:septal ring factor EnvC (AmiA/AmiB activator)